MKVTAALRSLWRVAALALALLHGFEATAAETATGPTPLQVPGLHNVFRVTDRLISGSQPEGEVAFGELARLGVKTIVSVDGGKPDVATARKYGLRYVHLPIGYDGIPGARIPELVRAASAPTGLVYVHCHHGKHRGPAAIAVMCQATSGWSPERAEQWLRQAGTAAEYTGLYRAVRKFQPVTPEQLARVRELPEVAKTPDLVVAMVAIDERFDALKAMQKAGWKTPPGQPDLTPAHEAALLWEHFRELARADDTAKRPEDYRTKLADSQNAAEVLRLGLRGAALDFPALAAAMRQVGQNCVECHQAFRDERK
jgi:protein tyrosine phosphatase (PTP) superfamily phosphohydrolase (DUF442 family)